MGHNPHKNPSAVRALKPTGIVPDNRLVSKKTSVKRTRLVNPFGIVPAKRLLFNASDFSRVKRPIWVGIVPLTIAPII